MQLKLDEINEIFEKLIDEKITREEADRWAYMRMQAFDLGQLEFIPAANEQILWSAIQYLYGIDMKVSPTEYMHPVEEIQEAFEERWKK
jgi:murein tripeptide amidase MpaA